MEFCEIYFLTKFVPESIKVNLHISSAPFWNGVSVSNLLILSNLLFFGFCWLRYAKHLCSFFGSDSSKISHCDLKLDSAARQQWKWYIACHIYKWALEKKLDHIACVIAHFSTNGKIRFCCKKVHIVNSKYWHFFVYLAVQRFENLILHNH